VTGCWGCSCGLGCRSSPRRWRCWARPASVAAATALVELAVAVLVALPTYGLGLGLSALVMIVFCGAIVRSTRVGRRVTCRCFGRSGAVLGRAHLVRNTLIAVWAAAALTVPATATLNEGAVTAAGLVGAFAALVAITWDGLAGLVAADPANR
jgi:hypothetical protein